MKHAGFSPAISRRQLLAGTLALAGNAVSAKREYAPRIVCNETLWTQFLSNPIIYVSSTPDPLKVPPPPPPARRLPPVTWGSTDEHWHSVLSDMQAAGYRRWEVRSVTLKTKPIEDVLALLDRYGLVVNHVFHSVLYTGGLLYPARVGEDSIARTIEVLDLCKPLKTVEFVLDPFGDLGPLSDNQARTQNRGLDRIGREAKDRGMKLCLHNHEGPMRYGAKEWLGVLRNTDPALVSMCLDLDWTWQAGTDPLPLLHEAGDKGRLGALHMRTQRGRITDQTMEDGGDIDYNKVAAYLKEIKFDGALVEETEPMKETRWTRTIRENKRMARIWCEKVFGVSAKT
ncbi:MAG: hypothetical protein DMG07_03370 [Acidobacteria bacterium]|nr:MAG: hypothetical protein DMG07_03370 [Acidobacteriota bacterium]